MKLKGRRQSQNIVDVRPKNDAFSNVARQQTDGQAALNRQNLNRRRAAKMDTSGIKDAVGEMIKKMNKPKAAKKQGRVKRPVGGR